MRLIDADKFKDNILSGLYVFCQENKEDIARAIDDEPTVVIQTEHFVDLDKIKTDCLNCGKFERPQGEWIPNYTSQFMNPGRQCSLCGKIVEFSENYCPQCGANMRGKEE